MATGQAAGTEPAVGMRGSPGTVERCVDGALFKKVMGLFATGITVITTQAEGRTHGMTANAFMAGSLDPPLCVIAVGNRTRLYERLGRSRRYGVSILGEGHSELSNHFAGRVGTQPEPEFRYLGGVPVLDGALAVIAADVVGALACGDHTLFIGHISAMEAAPAAPLLYFRGRYARLDSAGADQEVIPPMFW